jgi:hypothetical protein
MEEVLETKAADVFPAVSVLLVTGLNVHWDAVHIGLLEQVDRNAGLALAAAPLEHAQAVCKAACSTLEMRSSARIPCGLPPMPSFLRSADRGTEM